MKVDKIRSSQPIKSEHKVMIKFEQFLDQEIRETKLILKQRFK